MFTGNSYFGLNLVSLVGLAMTALGLSVARMQPNRRGIAIGVMALGTALIFVGFYLVPPPP